MGPFTDIKFHPVGQGLFTSIEICDENNRKIFSIIFDCGSTKSCSRSLRQCIDKYIDNNSSRKVNLLTLSHLHYDHVSGLTRLLSEIDAETVVLPYLTPLERLLVAVSQRPKPLWYYSFLASPATFLAGLGIRNIVFLTGTGDEVHRNYLAVPQNHRMNIMVIEKDMLTGLE